MHKPSARRLQWTNGETWLQDLGAALPYSWRERAKPLGGRGQLILLVVALCCVVLLCVVLFVASNFLFLATILVESQHQPRQNGRLLCNHIIKSAPKTPSEVEGILKLLLPLVTSNKSIASYTNNGIP